MAYTKDDNTTQTIIRVGKAIAVHLGIGILLALAAIFATDDFSDASEALRRQFEASDDVQAGVMSILGIARGNLLSSCAWSLVTSAICSALFLSIAQRRDPRTAGEGASRLPLWILLFVIVIAGVSIFWWKLVLVTGVSGSLVSGSYTLAMVAIWLGPLLAYWLATGLSVVITMKPSVPLGFLLPNIWN